MGAHRFIRDRWIILKSVKDSMPRGPSDRLLIDHNFDNSSQISQDLRILKRSVDNLEICEGFDLQRSLTEVLHKPLRYP